MNDLSPDLPDLCLISILLKCYAFQVRFAFTELSQWSLLKIYS